MGKQNFLFVTFSLVLTMGLMQSYFMFQEYFSPQKEQLKQISQLKKVTQEKELRIAELENQIFDFQQEVAAALPALKKIEKKPQTLLIRSLASVAQKPANNFDLSSALNERARAEFRNGNFKKAVQSFSEVTQKFPTSPLVVQAYFFWAESLFMSGRHQECLDIVDQMMILFPDHELTGFIMLRMGQILQARSRGDEAIEVFQVVKRNFSFNHELRNQADHLSKVTE